MGARGDTPASTLVGSERRLAPLSWGACLGALALSAALLWRAACAPADAPGLASGPASAGLASRAGLFACVLATLLPQLWNLVALAADRGRASFGMIPWALASLAPAGLAYLLAGARGGWCLVALASLALGGAVGLFLLAGLAALRAAYRSRPDVTGIRAAIVLGAGVRDGRPGRTLELRLARVLGLWRAHPELLLVCTGGAGEGGRSEASVMADWLGERGVPASSLLVEDEAANTRQNLELSLALLRRRGCGLGERVCVVSSDCHLFRALREARRLGADCVGVPAATPLASLPQQWARELLTLALGR